jgi:hypothetical protein
MIEAPSRDWRLPQGNGPLAPFGYGRRRYKEVPVSFAADELQT